MMASFRSLKDVAPESGASEMTRTGFIAIVDDDEPVRRALARLIGAYSFQVQTYPSGCEFLESLSAGIPRCLILDLQMVDMTGLELLHHLSRMGMRIPTIVVTARDEPDARRNSESAGAFAFMTKPVMRDPLLRAINSAMGELPASALAPERIERSTVFGAR